MTEDFGEIYEKYYARIFNFVYYRLLNRENTEDVVSNVFFNAMKGIHYFDGKRASVSTWLFRIADNAVNDYFRKSPRTVPFDVAEIPVTEDCDVIRSDDLQWLHECLKTFDGRTRSVLALRYWGDFSYTEIASQTGLTEKNVSVILVRAKKTIKDFFEAKESRPKHAFL